MQELVEDPRLHAGALLERWSPDGLTTQTPPVVLPFPDLTGRIERLPPPPLRERMLQFSAHTLEALKDFCASQAWSSDGAWCVIQKVLRSRTWSFPCAVAGPRHVGKQRPPVVHRRCGQSHSGQPATTEPHNQSIQVDRSPIHLNGDGGVQAAIAAILHAG